MAKDFGKLTVRIVNREVNDADFRAFATQRTLRNRHQARGVVKRYPSPGDRMWGLVSNAFLASLSSSLPIIMCYALIFWQIYDRCHRAKCRWFVVTTHDNWTFGVFSRGKLSSRTLSMSPPAVSGAVLPHADVTLFAFFNRTNRMDYRVPNRAYLLRKFSGRYRCNKQNAEHPSKCPFLDSECYGL